MPTGKFGTFSIIPKHDLAGCLSETINNTILILNLKLRDNVTETVSIRIPEPVNFSHHNPISPTVPQGTLRTKVQ